MTKKFKRIISVICISVLAVCSISNVCFAEQNNNQIIIYGEDSRNNILTYNLYINNQHIESNNMIIIRDSLVLFPFRTIFESLGGSVVWNETNGDITLNYKSKNYICYIAEPNPGFRQYFYVKDAVTNENIKLTSMSFGGGFDIIDDYTYLYQDTAERLFRALGCKVEVDTNSKTVHISSND